jgi:hypothetical protein
MRVKMILPALTDGQRQSTKEAGRLAGLDVDLADIHGQHKFNFKHSAISRDDSHRVENLGRNGVLELE